MIDFAPLLTLEATHAYYGGRCPDFGFFLPPATARRLAGLRCLAKTRDGVLTVLYEKNAQGDPLVSPAGSVLQFGLRLANPYFANFTALPPAYAEGLPLYRNAGADPARLQAPVPLLLNQAFAEDAELMREGPFCLVEVTVDAGFLTDPPRFEVAFEAREETLRYYVVARNYTQAEFNQLAVTDEGAGIESRPPIGFTRVAPSQFGEEELDAGVLGGEGARIALFRSDQKVARREQARRRIQLARNGDPVIPQLPQPGPGNATANLVIHLSKP